ncbi:MFS transporter [Vibrio profundum]|uniref:MFS transporter n=1 Tax=Vibrio profundum TaxID=2910247 RepID=UPI003D14613A
MSSSNHSLSSSALLLLVAGQLLPQIDFSIVNVALDVMGRSLNAGESGLILIVALYALSFAALIATGGRLGDRYGRKRVFLFGVLGFGVASVLCGGAHSLSMMLVGRILQGICGALLMPQILATIHASLSGERHARAVGIYTSVAGLAVAVGQALGGWLVSADLMGMGWRMAFFINVPICLLIIGIGVVVIPESRAESNQSMDLGGITLFTLGLLCLLLPVSLGQRWPELWWLLAAIIPLWKGLYTIEKGKEAKGGQPLFPPSLFRTPGFRTGLYGVFAVAFTYAGFLFVVAFCLQSELTFRPFQSGNTFISLGVLFFFGSLVSKHLGRNLGDHRSFTLGVCITTMGFVLTTGLFWLFKKVLGVEDLIAAMGLVGLGNALMITSAFRIALANVSQSYASSASGAVVTMQQSCFALSTAFTGMLFSVALKLGYLIAISICIGVLATLLTVIGVSIYSNRPNALARPLDLSSKV